MRLGKHGWVVLTWLAVACVEPPHENLVLRPDSGLLAKMRLWTHRPADLGDIVLYPAPGVVWRDLLEIDPCGPFHPGMTAAEAQQAFGPPDDWPGGALYERAGVRYLITTRRFSTGSIPVLLPEKDASYDQWVLEAYPIARLVSDVFKPEVAGYVDGNRDKVTIMGEDHPAVHVRLNGLSVDYLYPTPWAGCAGDAR